MISERFHTGNMDPDMYKWDKNSMKVDSSATCPPALVHTPFPEAIGL